LRIGANRAKSNIGVGTNFSHRRENPFKKLPSGTHATIVRYVQRQRCKNLQRPSKLWRFENKNVFFYTEKTLKSTKTLAL
jgi:hypothetical protein